MELLTAQAQEQPTRKAEEPGPNSAGWVEGGVCVNQ